MYYLIKHNRRTKETECIEFSDYSEVRDIALKKELFYFEKNKREMEVVVFEANSLDDLKDTHSRYFVNENDNTPGLFSAVGLVGLAICLLNKQN